MIDNLSLGLTHGLLVLAIWQLLRRPELDDERAGEKGFRRRGGLRERDPHA